MVGIPAKASLRSIRATSGNLSVHYSSQYAVQVVSGVDTVLPDRPGDSSSSLGIIRMCMCRYMHVYIAVF